MAGSKPLPGVLRWNLGDLTVTALNDGWFQASLDLVTGIDKGEAARLQRAGFRTEQPKITLNAFLITGPGRKPVLVDTGYGALAPVETMGRLGAALATTGVAPEDVETVLITHLHPDHCGGLAQDGKAVYPNAEIVVHSDEAAFWLPDEALSKAPRMPNRISRARGMPWRPMPAGCASIAAARCFPASRRSISPAIRRGIAASACRRAPSRC